MRLRFENFLYSVNLTGREIIDYLEYSYGQWFNHMKDLRFHMMEWMNVQQVIEPAAYDNWTVIPHSWWMKGKERDRKILFPFEE